MAERLPSILPFLSNAFTAAEAQRGATQRQAFGLLSRGIESAGAGIGSLVDALTTTDAEQREARRENLEIQDIEARIKDRSRKRRFQDRTEVLNIMQVTGMSREDALKFQRGEELPEGFIQESIQQIKDDDLARKVALAMGTGLIRDATGVDLTDEQEEKFADLVDDGFSKLLAGDLEAGFSMLRGAAVHLGSLKSKENVNQQGIASVQRVIESILRNADSFSGLDQSEIEKIVTKFENSAGLEEGSVQSGMLRAILELISVAVPELETFSEAINRALGQGGEIPATREGQLDEGARRDAFFNALIQNMPLTRTLEEQEGQ